jgi:hypothetical protein
LKLAKNAKGIAQNAEESSAGRYQDTQNIVAKVFEYADDDTWLVAEKAKKVTEKRIKELTGIPSLNDLYYYVRNFDSSNHGRGNIFHQEPETIEFFNENEFAQEITEFIANYGQQPGDYGRPSTYGEVLRDGQPTIVLTDYGLTDEVYNTYYDSKRKQPYRMYELYNFADGNDDILSDAGGGEDIRHAMWAQMPYGVGDGDGVINEEFIHFVSNRDYYPTRPTPSMPIMVEGFHECVNNLNEILNHVDDKKKFYSNLLKLQEYLITQGFYDREPLELNEQEASVETPPVLRDTLENTTYANELAYAAAKKLNLTITKSLGGGSNGQAFLLSNNVVLKITADISEADAAFKTIRAKPKTIADIYQVYKLVDTEKNLAFFLILQEYIENKPTQTFHQYTNIINTIMPSGMDWGDILISIKRDSKFNYDAMIEVAKHLLTDKPEANIDENLRQQTYQFLVGILNIRQDLFTLGISSWDYSNMENLGYKNNLLTFFDVGGYKAVEPPINKDRIIFLPEGEELLSEDYDRKTADEIANKVAEIKGYNKPQYIGSGTLGVAYDIGNDKVLKITKDNSEAAENLMLIGKSLKYIAQPYNVFKVTPKDNPLSGNTLRETYAIVLEKLKTNTLEFQRLFDRINFAFGKIMNIKFGDAIEYYLHGKNTYDDEVDKAKVEKYFSKNPQDAEYFYGILRIAEEADKYGIESKDYYNPENLGYKKNGAIGFFDVGFGNFFLKPENAEKIEVEEDGSSRYSTDNAIGQDDFPTYNQNDTSPSIENDLNANRVNNEDLEYRHVNDATKDEYVLNERELSAMKGSSTVTVKKKCRLGGLGNTSAACNQGNISNLDIKPLKESTATCKPIKITLEIEEYVKKFDSDESLLRSGGLPIDLLDKAAFGFDDTLNKIAPKHLTVKWKDDMENVIHEIQRTGLSDYTWAKKFNLTEPIDVSFDGKKFYVEDGHHRYYAAKILNVPLNINLEIRANPIKVLGQGMDYDDFHRCLWKQIHEKIDEGVADTYAEKQFHINPEHSDFEVKYNAEKNLENQEEVIKYGNGVYEIVMIKNPKSMENIGPEVRGIIDSEGNLYVEQKSYYTHSILLGALDKLSLVKNVEFWHLKLPTNFITVVRYGKTNKFLLGESNMTMISREKKKDINDDVPSREESTPVFQKFLDKAKQKNPNLIFINEIIYHYNQEPENINEAQIISFNINEAKLMMKII